jgi:phage repressor protein C with HTH and peptisase S24 domain
MSWATKYIELLKQGNTVKFRPHGNSMQPRIESGQLVTVVPSNGVLPLVGAIVLCKVDGKQWLHLVSAHGSDGRIQISNNKGHVNGWCTTDNVFGIVTLVEP